MIWILVEVALLLGAIGLFVAALELGFRLGVRRQAKADAIGTAALRGGLLPAPHAERTTALFREYVDSRLQYNAAGRNDDKIAAAEARAGRIEEELWSISRILLTEDPRSQPASLYTQALNEVFDIREERRFALGDRVPAAVTFMLFMVSTVAMALVGYGCGLNGRRRPLANLTFACLIALVLTIILDIDAPRVGFVTVSPESLIRLQESLRSGP